MTFYYHFKDIYDLVEWVCIEDGKRALQDKKTYDTWQEGMGQNLRGCSGKPSVYHERVPFHQQGQDRELSV